jgi:hypothetical protein
MPTAWNNAAATLAPIAPAQLRVSVAPAEFQDGSFGKKAAETRQSESSRPKASSKMAMISLRLLFRKVIIRGFSSRCVVAMETPECRSKLKF